MSKSLFLDNLFRHILSHSKYPGLRPRESWKGKNMTLEEAIEKLEDITSDETSWIRLTKQGKGMMFISLLKWLKELRVYREKAKGNGL